MAIIKKCVKDKKWRITNHALKAGNYHRLPPGRAQVDRRENQEEITMTDCRFCGGKTIPKTVDVQRNWRGKLVVITNVPAYVCEQCGEQYFDAEVALEMDRIKRATHVSGERLIQVPVRPYGAEIHT
ncbi:type II toxin-antitoxin system MqsA family antitoxin [Desulfofundulus thermobenzoicus]|nr:type II toxin-antitoxin system MqsA family antitoxin [Desulfofundulus thermobenzoicus]